MDSRFAGIQVLIWDFDGTLYRPNAALFEATRQAEYRVIMDHTGWDSARTDQEFKKLHHVKYDSGTEITSVLTGIPMPQAAGEMEEYFDRRDFLRRDEKLIQLFRKLSGYRHFLLANGIQKKHKETLAVLGIPWETFEEDVTSETVGVTKPHPAGFQHILAKTGLPAGVHIMIGDREAVDLAPAKALGMKTCLVWSTVPSAVADVTIPTIYDVPLIV